MTVYWIYHVLIIVFTFTYLFNYDYANADAINSCSCAKWWLFRLCWRILPIYLCCDHFIFFAFLSADLAELIESIVFHFFHSVVSLCFAVPWIWHSVKLCYFFAVFLALPVLITCGLKKMTVYISLLLETGVEARLVHNDWHLWNRTPTCLFNKSDKNA